MASFMCFACITSIISLTCSALFFESVGSVIGHWVKVVQPVHFLQGYNDLLLLSETVGLQVKV